MKIVEEDVTTYQECLGSYLKKIFQRSDVVCNVFETQTKERYCTPPTPPTRNTPKKKQHLQNSDNSPAPRQGRRHLKTSPTFSVTLKSTKKKTAPQPGAPCPGPAGFSKRLGESDTSPLCPQGAPHTGTRRHRPGLAKNRWGNRQSLTIINRY